MCDNDMSVIFTEDEVLSISCDDVGKYATGLPVLLKITEKSTVRIEVRLCLLGLLTAIL